MRVVEPSLQAPWENAPPPDTRVVVRRLLAFVVDGVLVWLVAGVVGRPLTPLHLTVGSLGSSVSVLQLLFGKPVAPFWPLVAPVLLLYFITFEALFGLTPGKAFAGLRVVNRDGTRAGLGPVALRNLAAPRRRVERAPLARVRCHSPLAATATHRGPAGRDARRRRPLRSRIIPIAGQRAATGALLCAWPTSGVPRLPLAGLPEPRARGGRPRVEQRTTGRPLVEFDCAAVRNRRGVLALERGPAASHQPLPHVHGAVRGRDESASAQPYLLRHGSPQLGQ